MDQTPHTKVRIVIDDKVIDKNDFSKIIEPVWHVDIYDGVEKYEKDLREFTLEQKFALAIFWYQTEVNNGGHLQFYDNSTGIVWEDALAGLREMELEEYYNILKESADRLGGSPNKDRTERQKQLSTINPDFRDLDNRFYELDARNPLDEGVMRYIKENRQKFYFDDIIERPE